MKTEELIKKHLNEREPQTSAPREEEVEIKKFNFTMKTLHQLWKKTSGNMDLAQLKNVNTALGMVIKHITPKKRGKSSIPGPRGRIKF